MVTAQFTEAMAKLAGLVAFAIEAFAAIEEVVELATFISYLQLDRNLANVHKIEHEAQLEVEQIKVVEVFAVEATEAAIVLAIALVTSYSIVQVIVMEVFIMVATAMVVLGNFASP